MLSYILIPAGAIMLGGIAAAYRPPGGRLRSSVQHFAAGIVFAAVALELLPDIMHQGSPVAAVVGFAIGVATMLGVKQVSSRLGGEGEPPSELAESGLPSAPRSAGQPTGLLIILGIDVLTDGLLIGIGFAAGAKQGFLLTVALTVEVLFLGLSAAVALTAAGASKTRVIGVTAGLAALLCVGAGLGVVLSSKLSGVWLEGVLSFGAAALLYLVTEELLTEAHEEPETPLLTATFFFGFLVLLVLEMLG